MNPSIVREVKLGEKSYNVLVGDKLSNLGREISKIGLKGKALVLSHPRIMHFHGKALVEGLRDFFDTAICEIPEGEKSKSEKRLSNVYDACQKNKIERKDTVICFGGGVIGDLGGYVAANWLRGINVVQVPTTLVAQVDSSIGGKTGIDWGRIKNRIGIFKQPRLVFTDVNTLQTLSKRQFNNGIAEVIKYGILDEGIWNLLNDKKSKILSRDLEVLATIVWNCTNLKCDVVEMDEFDQKGLRAKLNLGHTVGHGIEGASNFRLLHGEAISLGLVAAAKLSAKKLLLDNKSVSSIIELLSFFDLPTSLESLSLNKNIIVELTFSDKKVESGKLRFVLIEKIGKATFLHIVTEEEVRETLTG